jgi:8-oxo-dGTP pyrophosphatase MutT (NUDIX family)
MEKNINGARGIVYLKENPIKYLLVESKRGIIAFPGGRLEKKDDSVSEVMIRELEEETGLRKEDCKIKETNIIDKFKYSKDKSNSADSVARHQVFLIETNKGIFQSEDPEIKVLGLFTEEEVLEKLSFKNTKDIFKKVIKYID